MMLGCTAPGSPESQLCEYQLGWRFRLLLMIRLLELGGRHVADRLEEATGVEPVDPFERRELHVHQAAPGTSAPDDYVELIRRGREPVRFSVRTGGFVPDIDIQ